MRKTGIDINDFNKIIDVPSSHKDDEEETGPKSSVEDHVINTERDSSAPIELKKLQEDIHRLYAYINANHPTGPQNEEWQQATTSHQVSPSIPKLACSGRN